VLTPLGKNLNINYNCCCKLYLGNKTCKPGKGTNMEAVMTDKQMELLITLVADKILACKDMDEVKKAVEELKKLVKKE